MITLEKRAFGVAVVVLGVVAAAGSWSRMKRSSLAVTCDRQQLDFGEVEPYATPEMTCTVTNESDQQVVLGIEADCHCVHVEPRMDELAPGESRRVVVRLRPRTSSPKRDHYKRVHSNVRIHLRSADEAKTFVLPVSAREFRPVELDEELASWLVPIGVSTSRDFSLSVDEEFKPLRITSVPNFVETATLRRSEQSKKYRIDVVTKPKQSGSASGLIRLELLDRRSPPDPVKVEIPLQISTTGISPIECSPPAVFADELDEVEPWLITVKSVVDDFAVASITAVGSPPEVRVTVKPPDSLAIFRAHSQPDSASTQADSASGSERRRLRFSVTLESSHSPKPITYRASVPVL